MIKTRYDLHIHTVLSGHSDPGQTVAAIIERADALGLDTIAITEHVIYPAHLERSEQIRREVAACTPACRVLIGAEIDCDRDYSDGRLVLDDRTGFDYVLGSMHRLPGTDILPHCQPIPDWPEHEFLRLWRDTFLGLAENPLIDAIAHPGAMIANCIADPATALPTFVDAAARCAAHGIGWEVNDLIGKKLPPRWRDAYAVILGVAADAGVPLVFGSDAHAPEDVGRTDFVAPLLKTLGRLDVMQSPQLPRLCAV